MEEISEYILRVSSDGNLLAYKMLTNLAIDMVLEGFTPKQVIERIEHLLTPIEERKL